MVVSYRVLLQEMTTVRVGTPKEHVFQVVLRVLTRNSHISAVMMATACHILIYFTVQISPLLRILIHCSATLSVALLA
jgi:hypothetical protein